MKLKCRQCNHSVSWHINKSECMYPKEKCNCTGVSDVVGIDFMSLLFFTGMGAALASVGLLNIFVGQISGSSSINLTVYGLITLSFGLFIATFLNVRGQKRAKKYALSQEKGL